MASSRSKLRVAVRTLVKMLGAAFVGGIAAAEAMPASTARRARIGVVEISAFGA
jgi:hypothetical protein